MCPITVYTTWKASLKQTVWHCGCDVPISHNSVVSESSVFMCVSITLCDRISHNILFSTSFCYSQLILSWIYIFCVLVHCCIRTNRSGFVLLVLLAIFLNMCVLMLTRILLTAERQRNREHFYTPFAVRLVTWCQEFSQMKKNGCVSVCL